MGDETSEAQEVLSNNKWYDTWNSRIGTRRDFFDLAAVGIGAIFGGAIAGLQLIITSNQTSIMNRQNEIARDQLSVQRFNSLPNFVIDEFAQSTVGSIDPTILRISNSGGWARAANVEVNTDWLLQDVESGSTSSMQIPIDRYLHVVSIDRGPLEEPLAWELSSKWTEDVLERFVGELLEHVGEKMDLSRLHFRFQYEVTFEYSDYQGNLRSERYGLRVELGEIRDEDKTRLSLMGESEFMVLRTDTRLQRQSESRTIPTYDDVREEDWKQRITNLSRDIQEHFGV